MTLFTGRLLGTTSDAAVGAFSEAKLEILFVRCGLGTHQPADWYGKSQLVSRTVMSILRAHKRALDLGQEDTLSKLSSAVQMFVVEVAKQVAPPDPDLVDDPTQRFHQLREAARADGYDLIADYTVSGTDWDRKVELASVRLLPFDEPRAPVSEAVTVLEADLNRLGLTVALRSYRQAVASLIDQRFEAANGQIRATLEAILTALAVQEGFVSTKQGDGGKAISYLIDNGHLPPRDGGDFIRGLWSMTHTNGPHPGTSDAGEAFFRVQVITGAARYLIDRFAPRT